MDITMANFNSFHDHNSSFCFTPAENSDCHIFPEQLPYFEDPLLAQVDLPMSKIDEDLDLDIHMDDFEAIMEEDPSSFLERVPFEQIGSGTNLQALLSGESSGLSVGSESPRQKDGSVLASDWKWKSQGFDFNDAKSECCKETDDSSERGYGYAKQDVKSFGEIQDSTSTKSMKQDAGTKVLVDLTDTDSEVEEGSDMTVDCIKRKLPVWATCGERVKNEVSSKYYSKFQCLEAKPRREQISHGPAVVFSSCNSSSAISLPARPEPSIQGSLLSLEYLTATYPFPGGVGLKIPDGLLGARQGIGSVSLSEGLPQACKSLDKGFQRVFPSTLAPRLDAMKGAVSRHDGETTSRSVLKDVDDIQFIDEACPDEGLLAVPLLKHQKMALAWMEKKERGPVCAGGILADDQGLGKTVSTIALILKAKPPGSKCILESSKQIQAETTTVNLDDEDDDQGHGRKKQIQTGAVDRGLLTNKQRPEKKVLVSKGRPSAGTLVVCPTSVLKQWSQELKEKVTQAAELSVLVYHGSNRTKDPIELAKHDVVLTTYSIVSMEVPKQPLLDEKEYDDRVPANYGLDALSCSTNTKKRQKESRKDKKGRDKNGEVEALDHPDSGPLAKVAWFRVILDEAQNIKNRRTQVARACWSLRAKRRWCLSGTPIQNAIDDLYSYFRFLKYDPFALYKSFCTEIKEPIVRNPHQGYQNLQSILLKVMLRRTKATTINGEPIVNLPQKNVKMKQVEFSPEERAFYTNLEIQSRKQFQVYAAAGTVQRNYVNILWMLLRLRQACDHPLLVKDHHGEAAQRNALESVSKIPVEKRTLLLTVLEGNCAMCRVCMDAPEEPVISVCAHVFCRQCISERLNHNDDTCCPVPKCHAVLNSSLIYSASALKIPSGEIKAPVHNGIFMESGGILKEHAPKSSSKIEAVIDTLRALPPLQFSQRIPDIAVVDMLGVEVVRELDTLYDQNKTLTEKALVFSQWTSMLDLLEGSLKREGFCYRRLDGTMSVLARDRALSDFKLLPEVTVMIMSLKAASLGLNLVVACHVLLLDVWWNPTTEDQAIDRAHRIGQSRDVTVSRFTVKNTIEDRILALQDRKRQIVASAFGEDTAGEQRTRLTVDDMHYLFRV